jgi:hypothetical protein
MLTEASSLTEVQNDVVLQKHLLYCQAVTWLIGRHPRSTRYN